MNIALYGRISSGKDTVADMLCVALTYWKAGIALESVWQYSDINFVVNFSNQTKKDKKRFYRLTTGDGVTPFKDILCMSFSTRIHEMTSLLASVPMEQCLDRMNKETLIPPGFNKTIRQIMIDIGEGLRASYGPEVWIAPLLNEIKLNRKSLFIIPGMRHPNEYSALQSLGNTIFIKVKSDFEVIKGEEFAEGLLENHKFDVTIDNKKGDLTGLWHQVVNIVYSYGDKITLDYAN